MRFQRRKGPFGRVVGLVLTLFTGTQKQMKTPPPHAITTNPQTNPTTPPSAEGAPDLRPAGSLSPDTVSRLDAARIRLAECDKLRGILEETHAKHVRRNVACSATPAGAAWHDLEARARIWRKQVSGEIDALLDGDEERARSKAGVVETMRGVVCLYVDRLWDEIDADLRER
jgi:hypothetical protein